MHIRSLQNTVLFEGTLEEKLVWKMLQDYQLILMVILKLQILELTIINKHSTLVALIFQWKQRRGNAKDHLCRRFTLS